MLLKCLVYAWLVSLCLADFDETLIYCKTPPPKLTNGLIKRDRVSYYKGNGYLGSMEYMCLPGFNLLGDKVVTCQNGVWSAMTQCIPKKRCSPIRTYPRNTAIESNNITFFHNDPQQIIVGSSVTLRCLQNYELDPASGASLSIQCQNDGSWTPMPSCRHAQAMCNYSKLYLPARSRITRMDFKFSEHDRQLHTIGSSLEYTCEDGYRLHDGKASLIVECLDSGAWSPLPVCEFVYQSQETVRCPYPTIIKNGYITLYNVTIWEDQTYTGQVAYECNYGFEMDDGNDQIVSDCRDGTWTKVTDCQEIPTCPKQELLDIEWQAENSYIHNVSLQYIRDPLAFAYNSYVLRVCLPNFEHDPSSPPLSIRCQRDTNTWTGAPICRAVKAPTMQMFSTNNNEYLVSNGNLILPVANTTASQFQTTPTEAESSTVAFDTTHTIACDANGIPSIPNTDIIRSPTRVTYAVGATLFYACQPGYESLSNQSSYITCSVNGRWSLDTINVTMCQPSSTTTAETPVETSATVVSSTTADNDLTSDLDEHLPVMNVSEEVLLPSTRSISAGDRQARHLVSHCKELPRIDHAQLLSDDTVKHSSNNELTYTGSLLFICQVGFLSDAGDHEPFRLTCHNGAFHPKVLCIEKPRCPLPPFSDMSRVSIVNSMINVFDMSTSEAIVDSFILLNCPNKTTNEHAVFNMTCLEHGQWSTPPSSCIAPFKRRCQSGITIPNARTQIHAKLTTDGYYNDGSRVTYQCLEYFVHDRQSGPLNIECRNGRWGPRARCIPMGCLEPMPDTIAHGRKSAESYVIYNDVKYYVLSRYSCQRNAVIVGSSSSVIDIQCQSNGWQYESLPACEMKE